MCVCVCVCLYILLYYVADLAPKENPAMQPSKSLSSDDLRFGPGYGGGASEISNVLF